MLKFVHTCLIKTSKKPGKRLTKHYNKISNTILRFLLLDFIIFFKKYTTTQILSQPVEETPNTVGFDKRLIYSGYVDTLNTVSSQSAALLLITADWGVQVLGLKVRKNSKKNIFLCRLDSNLQSSPRTHPLLSLHQNITCVHIPFLFLTYYTNLKCKWFVWEPKRI